MQRRVFTLTNVLSVALAGAMALLVVMAYRARDRWSPGETESTGKGKTSHTRVRESRTRTQIARDPAPEGAPLTSTAAPHILPATIAADASDRFPATDFTLRRNSWVWSEEGSPSNGQGGVSHLYSSEAGMAIAVALWQLGQVAHWPTETLSSGQSFAIGVLRDDNLRRNLAGALLGAKVEDRAIVIVGGEQAVTLASYPMVFVGVVTTTDMFAGRPVMSVTYTGASYADTWCTVELVWDERQIAYVVDRSALAARGIMLDDAFLKFEHVFVRDAQGQAVPAPERSSPKQDPTPGGGVLP